MLKKFRFFLSAALISALLISTFILSTPVRVHACEEEPPATLLTLYLKSDLIVVATVASEEDGKIITDEEAYSFVEVNRNLRISSVIKGKSNSDFVFTQNEYRSKIEQTEATNEEEDYMHDYNGYSRIKVGERYLFFFIKNEETGQYELMDEISGAKNLNEYELGVHKRRMRELKSIIKKKENQLPELTEWLIRCIEEPSTRRDGVLDLNNSFDAVEYGYQDETEEADKKPFAIDKDFHTYTPEIAKHVSDAQKGHISNILFGSLRQILSVEDKDDDISYDFTRLVTRWDKMRLAMYAFSLLQSADKADAVKTKKMMNYIAMLLDDQQLYEITGNFPTTDEIAEEVQTDKADSSETAETKTEVSAVNENKQAGENQTEVKANQESQTEVAEIKAENTEEAEPKQPTQAEIREKLLQDFISRYEYLLARGFQVEKEAGT